MDKYTPVEHDFFAMESKNNTNAATSAQPRKKLFDHRRSFRDIQSSISKLNPELLKSVIGSTNPNPNPNPNCSSESTLSMTSSTSLTIFYNGNVAVFDVPREKVDNILRMAEGGGLISNEAPKNSSVVELSGDFLPIARRKSLQRFLEKRQERVIMSSPYFLPDKNMSSRQ